MPKINAKILRWARETAGLKPEEAVKKLNLGDARGVTAVKRLEALESGKIEPTRPMLVKMAKQYRRPLLTFYMSAPPRQGDRGQDFRTLPDGYSFASDALLDVLIRDVQARQSMLRAVLEDEEAEPLPFIGSMNVSDGVSAVLASIQRTIRVDLAEYCAQPSPEHAFALLRSRVEAMGVFVLLIGDLGSYHTKFDLETFRGFALADNIAPFIIINSQDSKSAWSFTLLHELAHLWLGQTGVSGMRSEKTIEIFCNDVASEFLLPSEELLKIDSTASLEEIRNSINNFAKVRNLSRTMIAYKLFRRGSINRDTWLHLREAFREQWLRWREDNRSKAKKQEGGPSYYVLRRYRVGTSLIRLVQRMMAGGALTTSKVGKILGVKAKNVQALVDTIKPHGADRVV